MPCPQCFEDSCDLAVYTQRIDEINVRFTYSPGIYFYFLLAVFRSTFFTSAILEA